MRIVKLGIAPSERTIEAKCQRCHSVVEFLANEAKRVADQRDGDFLQIACPVCHHNITKAL